jgi:hypothetical protein
MKEVKIQNLLNISPEDTIKSLQDVQKALSQPSEASKHAESDSGHRMIEDTLNLLRNGGF